MMKRFVTVALLAAALGFVGPAGPIAGAASPRDSDIQVIMEGKRLAFPDARPFMDDNDRTLVPVRFVSEALGAQVAWHADVERVDIAMEDKYISLTVGEKKALLNGEEITFDTAAAIRNGRTFVPLRFVSEMLGTAVEWDGASRYIWLGEKIILTPEEKGIETKPFSEVISYFEGYDAFLKDSWGQLYTEYYDLMIDDLPIQIGEVTYISLEKIVLDGYVGVTSRVKGDGESVPNIFYVTDTFRPRYRYDIPSLMEKHADGTVSGTFRVVESIDWDIFGDKDYLSFSLSEADYIGMRDLNPMMVLFRNPFK
ncbi:copper amine oxidase N-terminal domain-containing protein [Paenibacillus sp. TRM 82003]|nr:copper amine oxidase N-terminal domain-containing protein [Paenibacillus sp. TRM 82003]